MRFSSQAQQLPAVFLELDALVLEPVGPVVAQTVPASSLRPVRAAPHRRIVLYPSRHTITVSARALHGLRFERRVTLKGYSPALAGELLSAS